MRVFVIVLLGLAGCAEWPDAGGGPVTGLQGPFPKLVPIADINGSISQADDQEAQGLAARAARLRSRAVILRQSASSQSEMEALRARLAR